MVATLVIHGITWITTHLPTLVGWKAELLCICIAHHAMPLMHYSAISAAKRWVFRADLMLSVLRAGTRRQSGSEFHSIGPATGSVTVTVESSTNTCAQSDIKSNPNPNPNPNPISKLHAIVNIQLNVVTCPTCHTRQCCYYARRQQNIICNKNKSKTYTDAHW